MRPDIGDVIHGIKRTLGEEILPALTDTFAREQLAYTLFLCEHLAARWDQAHMFTAEEYADLRATLAAAIDVGRRSTAPTASFTALLDGTAVALAADEASTARPLRVLSAAIAEFTGALVRLLAACADLPPADRKVCADVRTILCDFMKRQLARDEQWVSSAQIGWW
jgi:hypothetical protein